MKGEGERLRQKKARKRRMEKKVKNFTDLNQLFSHRKRDLVRTEGKRVKSLEKKKCPRLVLTHFDAF